MDAAHFVYGAFLGYMWCLTRLFIPSPAGRKRYNVLGALNAVTKEVVTVTNTSYINAHSVCELLFKLACHHGHLPITIVLDNARYQKCAVVQACADILEIELLYLPSYSPQLNLIERLWRFVKKECLYAKYYSSFDQFQFAIQHCLHLANSQHTPALDNLLTWNFQSFHKVHFLPD